MSNRILSFAIIALSLAASWAQPVQAQSESIATPNRQGTDETAQQEKVWLGVEVKTLTRTDLFNSDKRIPIGVQIIKVFDDSPASGLLNRGDMLTTMDGDRIPNATMLFSRLAKKKPGTKVMFGVQRGSRTGVVTVQLDTRTQDNGSHTTTVNSAPVPPPPSPQRLAAEAKPEPAVKPKPQQVAAKPETKPASAPQQAPKPQQQAKAEPAPASPPAPSMAMAQTETPQPEATAANIASAQAEPAPHADASKPRTTNTEAAVPAPAPSVVVAQAEVPHSGTPAPAPAKPQQPEKAEPASYTSACDGLGVYVGILPTQTKKLCLKPGGGKKAGQSFRDCPQCPEMVVIPSGSFTMGSPITEAGNSNGEHSDDESPQHKVTIAKPFAAGKYAVTFEEWDACVADGGCPEDLKRDRDNWGHGRRPVVNVRWKEARAYIKWLRQKTGQPYRLLSEAEWEYAARAGSTTPYWWGDKMKTTQANFSIDMNENGVKKYYGEPDGIIREKTVPVDEFEANPWGLYQVHGNVWEWVEDCYHRNYEDKPEELNKTGAAWTVGDCFYRRKRGGSWESMRYYNRSATRSYGEFDNDYDSDLGFRIARDLQKSPDN